MSKLRHIFLTASKASLLLAAFILAQLPAQGQKDKRPTSYNYLRGVEAFENGDWQDAAQYFVQELEENEHNGYAIGYLGHLYAIYERIGRSLTCYSEALKYVPEKDNDFIAQIHNGRSSAYWALGDTLKAIEEAKEAVRKAPKEALNALDLGTVHWHNGDYEEAERQILQAYRLDTTSVKAADYLASFYEDRKRYDEAYHWALRTIEKDSTSASAYMTACRSAYHQQRYSDAARMLAAAYRMESPEAIYFTDSIAQANYEATKNAFTEALKQWPDNPYLYFGLSTAQSRTLRPASALKSIKESVKRDDNIEMLVVAAGLADAIYDFDEAEKLVNQAMDKDSTDYDARQLKAELLIQSENPGASIPILDALIEANPMNGDFYALRANALRYSENEAEALRDAEYAAALNDDDASSQLLYARLLLREGREEEARYYLQRTVDADTLMGGGDDKMLALAYLGHEQEAVATCDSLLKKDSENVAEGRMAQSHHWLYYAAARLYALLGQNDQALKYLQRAFELNFRAFFNLGHEYIFSGLRKEEAFQTLVETYRNKPTNWQ